MKNKPVVKFFSIFFTSMILCSLLLFFLFLNQNHLSWSDYWHNPTSYGNISLPKLKFTKGIQTLHTEKNFPLLTKIKISVDIEEVSFVEEDRNDILVVYDYRYPTSSDYNINFNAFSINQEIQVVASTKAKHKSNIPVPSNNTNSIYRGSIVVHLPYNYHFESLFLITSYLNINSNMLYQNASSYSLASSTGNINLIINQPKQSLSIQSDLGNVSIEANAPLQTLDLTSNLGDVDLRFKKELGTLYLINNYGKNTVVLNDMLDAANIQNNLGDIELSLKELPNTLSTATVSGNITVFMNKNNSTFLHSDTGNTSCYFHSIDVSESTINFHSQRGNINILPIKN